jgi:hypothetical protein
MKPIPGFPGYFATADGWIWSNKRNHGKHIYRLRKNVANNGYVSTTLQRDGVAYKKTVAWCVLTAFVGPAPKRHMVCHGVGGRHDDRLENLSWGTWHKNNITDKLRDGTIQRGENHGRARLNELQVRIIRRAHSRYGTGGGLGCTTLAEIFKVTEGQILHILKKRTWKHVA